MNCVANENRSRSSTWCGIALPMFALCAWVSVCQASSAEAFPQDPTQALNMADFILSMEDSNGAIADAPGAGTANNDSNMEYALIGLAAAYSYSHNASYLAGFEKGIGWLAAREDMTDTTWRGSWYLQYSSIPPYDEIPVSGGPGTTNVRGVDATSALFVYLLYLDQRLTGCNALVQTYANHAQAALDFIINHNLDSDGLSWSSWLYYSAPKQWELYQEKYSADQGDVYLGMHAGALIYGSSAYASAADTLMTKTPVSIFNPSQKRYAIGMFADGTLDNSTDGYSEGFAQGYLSWMWGNTPQNQEGMTWFRSKVGSNGSIVTKSGAPAYSLNVAMLGLGDNGLAVAAPVKSFAWLINKTYVPSNGGVYDSLESGDTIEFDNVTGFCAASLFGFLPFD